MARNSGTDTRGSSFGPSKVEQVWAKGRPVPGRDTNTWRQDMCGKLMKRSDHGKHSEYGWEIDHIKPVSKGGSDDLPNLQPLHWKNNQDKGDTYPWSCP